MQGIDGEFTGTGGDRVLGWAEWALIRAFAAVLWAERLFYPRWAGIDPFPSPAAVPQAPPAAARLRPMSTTIRRSRRRAADNRRSG